MIKDDKMEGIIILPNYMCKTIDGKYHQIRFVQINSSTGKLVVNGTIDECDIVETEPLVTGGDLQWAIQSLKLGNCVYVKGYKPNTGPYYKLDDDGMVREYNSNHKIKGHTMDEWTSWQSMRRDVSGWDIYCEMPPFKVGDWVKEQFANVHARVIIVGDDYLVVKLCDGYSMSVTYQKRYCKVINPSDVIIHIGNGISGTVEPLNCECCKDKVFILRISKDEFIEIPLSVVKGPLQMIIDNLIEDIRNNTK